MFVLRLHVVRCQGKEVATEVRLLPQGTVIFEDISIEQFEGTVTKVIPKVPNKNQVNKPQMLRHGPTVKFILMSDEEFEV